MPTPPKPNQALNQVVKVLRNYGHYVLYFLYVFMATFVIVNLLFPISTLPILSIESYKPPTSYNWIITVPESPPNSLHIENATVILIVDITTAHSLADGVPVTISARAGEASLSATQIKSMLIGFEGAYWYPLSPNGYQVSSPLAGVTLTPDPNATLNGLVYFFPWSENETSVIFPKTSRDVIFREPRDCPATL